MFKSNWGRKPSHGSFSGFSLRGAPVSNDSPCQRTGLRTAAGQPPPPHTHSVHPAHQPPVVGAFSLSLCFLSLFGKAGMQAP